MSPLERREWSAIGRQLVDVPCNLCGERSPHPLTRENDLEVVRCRACGLIYVSPRPDASELLQFYEDYFDEASESDWHRLMLPGFRRDAERLEARLGGSGRVLDVGTGFGHFLELMREKGWEVEAVEPAPAAIARLEKKGIPVHCGAAPEVPLPKAAYDAIVTTSVLEHVADPLGVLRWARAALRPGGWLLVRVPNVQLLSLFLPLRRFEHVELIRTLLRAIRREVMEERNLFHVIDPPAHLFGFSAHTLRAALEGAGFTSVLLERDPMHRRGTALNTWIDGSVHRVARLLGGMSGGRLELSPNLTALARRGSDG